MTWAKKLKQSETSTKHPVALRAAIEPRANRSRKRHARTGSAGQPQTPEFGPAGISTRDILTSDVYTQLSVTAQRFMSRERPNVDFDAEDLLNQACIRLLKHGKSWTSRAHFFMAANRIMVQLLIDWARRRDTLKRGGNWQRVDVADLTAVSADSSSNAVALRQAMAKLKHSFPRKYQVLVLRGVEGLKVGETAEALGVSASTVKSDWATACAWVRNEISGPVQ